MTTRSPRLVQCHGAAVSPAPERIRPSEETISVAVHATDPVTELALLSLLRESADLAPVSLGQSRSADVLVVTTDTADVAALRFIQHMSGSYPRSILIVGDGWHADLRTAVECGLRGVIWRSEFTPASFLSAVVSVNEGFAHFPPILQGMLIDDMQRAISGTLVPQRPAPSHLTEREIDVLRLLAEGRTFQEIASKLFCSERTVKNAIHAIMQRLHLRNRTHAVSYAVRCGLI